MRVFSLHVWSFMQIYQSTLCLAYVFSAVGFSLDIFLELLRCERHCIWEWVSERIDSIILRVSDVLSYTTLTKSAQQLCHRSILSSTLSLSCSLPSIRSVPYKRFFCTDFHYCEDGWMTAGAIFGYFVRLLSWMEDREWYCTFVRVECLNPKGCSKWISLFFFRLTFWGILLGRVETH